MLEKRISSNLQASKFLGFLRKFSQILLIQPTNEALRETPFHGQITQKVTTGLKKAFKKSLKFRNAESPKIFSFQSVYTIFMKLEYVILLWF